MFEYLQRKLNTMKKEYVIRNIINYVNAIAAQKTSSKGLCLLFGAGADITSGGKTFRKLKIDFINSNGYDVSSDISDQKLTEYFDTCVDKFSESGRCIELESIMRKYSSPSEGYEIVVLLAELGYIDAIVTTNFDLLLEETQKRLGIRPFDVFAPGVAVPKNFYEKRQNHNPIYMKMHGDLYGRYVSHLTKDEIEKKEYGTEYVQLLTYILRNYAVISVGYGGYDELIVEIFKDSINNLNTVFWCDVKEPDAEAPLVKLLEEHDKLNYVNCSFDSLFCELAGNILMNKDLPDINPHFIPSIVSAKINERIKIYEPSNPINKEITRDILIKEFEDFLTSIDKNLILVHGKKGRGKTTLMRQLIKYYNELTFIPVYIDTREKRSILEQFAKALGYKTDVPFALLYNFTKWCKENDTSVIFIVDEIDVRSVQNESIKYLKEIFDYLTVVKEYSAVKVILCIDRETYKNLNIKLLDTSYYQQISNVVEVTEFDLQELESFQISGIDIELSQLICEPYIWGMLSDDMNGLAYSLDRYIERYILNNVNENISHLLNSKNFLITMEKIARVSMGDGYDIKLNNTIIEYLKELGIVNELGRFTYEVFSEFYYYKFLKRQGFSRCVDIINHHGLDYSDEAHRSAYARFLSDVNSAEEVRITLDFLSDLLERNNSKYSILLIYETLQRIQSQNFILFENYLLSSDFQNNKITNILDFIWYTSVYASKDPFKILNISKKNSDNPFDAFIIKHEYLKCRLNRTISKENIADYINLINARTLYQEEEVNLCDLLYIVTEWGPDNLPFTNYEEMIKELRTLFSKQSQMEFAEDVYEAVADKISRYAYNILFNSGIDVEEKFIQTIHDFDLRRIYEKVIQGKILNENDYLQMLQKSIDIDNAWTFLVCNLVTVISMQNDFAATYEMLQNMLDKLGDEELVKKIDFYLSSVFMALYITQNDVFHEFSQFFGNVIKLYEKNLFELPKTRLATLHRFTDEFDMVFEDGFNPLAFYFYVSPSECYLYDKAWNNGKEYLYLYWTLVDELEESGNYKDILRVVHALGQMISIYPREGFEALENIPYYSHEIIKKGVLRILKENYLRYPHETMNFLTKARFNISIDDLIDIKSNRDSRWSNRTFEQLHWTRCMVNLSRIKEKDITRTFLANIFTSQSYKNFMVSFLKEIF